MKTFIEAIATQEGFYAAGTLPNRRNNPGDIEEGKFAQAHGALPADNSRFARFPDADTGFKAMRSLLSGHYVGLTVSQAINKWAPGVENNTDRYIRVVCELTGLTPETVLTVELLG